MSQQVVEMSSDEVKLLRGIQRVIDKQKQLDQAMKETGDAADAAGKKGEEAHDKLTNNEGLDQIKSMAIGWIGISSAITFATQALREHNEEKKRGLESVATLDDANRRLAQIAKPGELQSLQDTADRWSTTYGIDRDRTRALLFAARSTGFEDYAEDAARFDPVVSLEAQQVTAGKVPLLFNNTISARESTALTLAAAEQSDLDFESVARSLPTATAGSYASGSTPEETFALLSAAAAKFKSGDTAADRIKNLGLKLSLDEEFKGKGVVDALKRFQADPELKAKFAGDSVELNEAINSLVPLLPVIEERTKLLEEERAKVGTNDDILERKLRERLESKEYVSLQTTRAAEIKTEIAGEDAYAVEAGETATTKSDINTALIDRRADPLEKLTVRGAVSATELATDGESSAMNAAAAVASYLSPGRAGPMVTVGGPLTTGLREAQGAIRSAAEGGLGEEKFNRWVSTEIPVLGETLRLLYGVSKEQLDEMKRQRGNQHAAANAQAGRHSE